MGVFIPWTCSLTIYVPGFFPSISLYAYKLFFLYCFSNVYWIVTLLLTLFLLLIGHYTASHHHSTSISFLPSELKIKHMFILKYKENADLVS